VIRYLVGDATAPFIKGPKIIAHVCNDVGKWGLGFVMSVSAKWPDVRTSRLVQAGRARVRARSRALRAGSD
jgi:hypothetical protein